MFVFSYRCAEDTAAALQFPGGCRRLLAEAQLAEGLGPRLGVSAGLGGPRCRIPGVPAQGGTPAGHGGAMQTGRRRIRLLLALLLQTERSYSLHVPESRNSTNLLVYSVTLPLSSSHNAAPCYWNLSSLMVTGTPTVMTAPLSEVLHCLVT